MAALAIVLLAACASDDPTPAKSKGLSGFEVPLDGTVGLQVASYEPVAQARQRFIVGLVASQGQLVGFGTVRLEFAYGGTRDSPLKSTTVSFEIEGTYRLVAGQEPPANANGPRYIFPSDGLGVYGGDVTFDRAGYWLVRATALIQGEERVAEATFEVLTKSINPFPGEPAPRTANRLPGDPTVGPKAIDSRAAADGTVPDPELHGTTVAAAIAAAKPVMVVVSTPVYCISRFCGPITDSVQKLAQRYGARMAFVHAEVWNDFEKQMLNREAAEWMYRDGADPKEPWVFLVDAQGNVAQRWDNVSTDVELETAIKAIVGE